MKIKKLLDTNVAYQILDDSEASGCTWTAGGCAILARALNLAYGYEMFVLVESHTFIPHHLVVRTKDGMFMDYDGAVKDIARAFRKREGIKNPLTALKFTDRMVDLTEKHGIVFDEDASKRLAQLILHHGIED